MLCFVLPGLYVWFHGCMAPLLLGQSAFQKFGKIEIDNSKKVVTITYKKEKE